MTEPQIRGQRPATVLVFPCGSEIGLEIHRAMQFSRHVELVGASSLSSNHGAYVFRQYVDGVPLVGDPGFIDALNALIVSRRVDFIFPAHDDVVLGIARHLEELACLVIGSSRRTCEICRSKRMTYQALQGKLAVPRVFALNEPDIKFPVFLKPDVGQGSKGVHVAHNRGELDFYRAQDPSLLVLEYLPGSEYTVDCFSDRHGRLRFVGARERIRQVNGISVDTAPVRDVRLNEMACVIHAELAPRGAWFFQVRRNASGDFVLMEVAPRVSGSMGLYRTLGVNFPLLSVFDRMGQDVEVHCHEYDLRMDRALTCRFRASLEYAHVYIDLDDTILCKGQVNAQVVAFLYQCRNAGRQLHLLSRHDGDLRDTLQRNRLEQLFDTITHVDPGQTKAEFIRHPDAIFIDDSYAERSRVRAAVGIPTFEAASLESLIDWRT